MKLGLKAVQKLTLVAEVVPSTAQGDHKENYYYPVFGREIFRSGGRQWENPARIFA